MSKRSFRFALVTVAVTLALALAAGVWAGKEVLRYPERKHAGRGQTVAVEITHGMKFPDTVALLARAQLISRPSWFRLYAMHRGLANKVRAGKYQLRDDLSPHELLDLLVKGVEEIEVSVTLPEGKNLLEVCALLEEKGIAPAAELERIARDPEWLKSQGIAGETADGYLFPETYRFKKPSSPRKVLEQLVRQHRIVYEALRKEHAKSLGRLKKELGWGDREVVVMASIVEKETGDPAERGQVASVFYNRLTRDSFKSRRLETDPTIRYGCTVPVQKSAACREWDPAGRLHKKQLLDADNPYNTYQHAKLPPGPISNPGRASLAATMAPPATDYLFFVAKDWRSNCLRLCTVFAKTAEEHERNVLKYQK